MKNELKSYLWVFFIGLIISTFTVYRITEDIALFITLFLVMIYFAYIILHLLEKLIKKIPILHQFLNYFHFFLNMHDKENMINQNSVDIIIEKIDCVDITKYKNLKNFCYEIKNKLNLKEFPTILLSNRGFNCFIGGDVKPMIYLSEKEFNAGLINPILAHEIGHYYFQDTKKNIFMTNLFLSLLLSLALLTNAYSFLLIAPIISLMFAIIFNYQSRQSEYRADLLSKALCGYDKKKELLDCFSNSEVVTKSRLFSTHPTIEQRIQNIKNNDFQLPKNKFNNLNYFNFMDSIVNQLKENDE